MVCLAFDGTISHSRNQLRIRRGTEDICVDAPSRFIDSAIQLCDGTRNVNDILASLPPSLNHEAFARFLAFLHEEGLLINANHLTLAALRYGRQMSPYGVSASAADIAKISHRFHPDSCGADEVDGEPVNNAPLAALFEARISEYTFDDASIELDQLLGMLWSVCGVVHAPHERLGSGAIRTTVPSAGSLQLLELFVCLQTTVASYGPGTYRVRFPAPRQVHLERINEDHEALMGVFAQPAHVRYATGAIFLAANIELAATKYRNRATQYLFTEAGAALQNGSLSAPRLELGYAVLGCYYEYAVQQLCELSAHQVVLGSAIFGPKPTPVQKEQLRRAPTFEFAWIMPESPRYALPAYMGRARRSGRHPIETWGVDKSSRQAYLKASAELIERQGFEQVPELPEAKTDDLEHWINPERFIQYTPTQFRRSTFPFQRFSLTATHRWKKAQTCGSSQEMWIPADLVYSHAALQRQSPPDHGEPLTYATTSGCAAGLTYAAALDRALLELIERDAFLRCWLQQCGGTSIPVETLPAEFQVRLQALQQAGCETGVQLLPSTWSTVIMIWAQHAELHFTTIGTAASDNPEIALSSALNELESRVFYWFNEPGPVKTRRLKDVRLATDHFLLYGMRQHYQKADRVLKIHRGTLGFHELRQLGKQACLPVAERFLQQDLVPVHVDITPSFPFVDQGRTALHVVKAFVPSLIPLWFGHGLAPLGMVAQYHANALFPHPFP